MTSPFDDDLRARITGLVDAAPPLTPAQVNALRALLRPTPEGEQDRSSANRS